MQALVCFIFIVAISFAIVRADIQKLKGIMEECIESTKASDADLEMMKSYQVPETREAKCLLACVQKGVGTLKDGSIVADALKKEIKNFNLDTQKQNSLEKSIDKCATITHTDDCELAANFVKCMHEDEQTKT